MNDKKMMLAAVIFGLLAVIVNWFYLTSAEGSKLKVLRANATILAGKKVSKEMFDEVPIYGDIAKMRSMVVPSEDFKSFNGLPVSETLEPGQLLLLRSFRIPKDNSIRNSISQGQRAISVRIQEESKAVAYFVQPGDKVDIWGIIGDSATLIVPSVCVKAVGNTDPFAAPTSSEEQGRYQTITILIKEAEVKDILSKLAVSGDKITLTLVGPCEATN